MCNEARRIEVEGVFVGRRDGWLQNSGKIRQETGETMNEEGPEENSVEGTVRAEE
jgi:hypothetical protein